MSYLYKKNKKKLKIHLGFIKFFFIKIYSKINFTKLVPKRWEKISKLSLQTHVYIHRGNGFSKVKLSDYHCGYKFGLFSHTRKPFIFRPKKKKNKRNSRR